MAGYLEVQSGEGTNVELFDADEDCLIVVDEATLVEMVRVAFRIPKFTVDDLISALEPFFPSED